MPWNVPRKYYDLFPLKDIELPPYTESDLDDVPPAGVQMAKPWGDHAEILKTGKWKNAIQGYLAATAYTDMNIGRLLDAFDRARIATTRSSSFGATTGGTSGKSSTGGNSRCGRRRRTRRSSGWRRASRSRAAAASARWIS